MSNEARRSYLKRLRERYSHASRLQKSLILNELCQVCGYHRKYAIRELCKQGQASQEEKNRPARRPGRAKQYGESLMPHLRYLWLMMERIGAKRMKEALRLWLKHYDGVPGGPALSDRDRFKLRRMSASTLYRLLSEIRSQVRGKSTTKVNALIKAQIPIGIMDYKIRKPGFMQADTVAHCGTSFYGEFAHTLTMTDVMSGWTENRAIWTKDSKQVRDQMESVERALPFDFHTIGTDCGTEFLNYRVMTYLLERRKPVHMQRSRPYQKDDNAFVEQKNWTHVRQLFGYDRIDDEALIALMNRIYVECWNPFQNYFLPTMKLVSKTREGGKIKKRYDAPRTPCQRLLESPEISETRKRQLRQKQKELNPFELKAELENRLKEYFKLLQAGKKKPIAA